MNALIARVLMPSERQIGQRLGVNVMSLHDEAKCFTDLKARRGRPDLDVDRHALTRAETLLGVVRMHRLPGGRTGGIKSAVADPQPAERNRSVLIECIECHADVLALRIELLQRDKQVHVGGPLRLNPETKLGVTRKFGGLPKPVAEHRPALSRIVLAGGRSRALGILQRAGARIEPQRYVAGLRQWPARRETLRRHPGP